MKKNSNRSFWDRFAGLYDAFIRKDKNAYIEIFRLIRARVTSNMHVLELATGTGLISIAIADKVNSIEATDFSPQMIAEAKKKKSPNNVNFSVQDACHLTYEDGSFDAVIISNALHIMPNPELALQNISRVLKKDGVLIAPTFTHASNDRRGKLKVKLMELVGFKAYNKWTTEQYCAFLVHNGFIIEQKRVLTASFPLTYVEATKGF
ncbi:class I SAM-dependent methyltransferase [Clostridium aminobutyricum]|uniref:Class I SAM-dependent methyltransferase n=1 Tax=Clostridium aminobutyricum TaxID=33953 RepID=A0A939IGV5_CLOAM|nr:class I SAM-dependent methyltransferase [Clostridium aminobutyricum]MBN7772602.1 class I SAM-dependent methyltransferase [Clostridium aminobutyricum]